MSNDTDTFTVITRYIKDENGQGIAETAYYTETELGELIELSVARRRASVQFVSTPTGKNLFYDSKHRGNTQS